VTPKKKKLPQVTLEMHTRCETEKIKKSKKKNTREMYEKNQKNQKTIKKSASLEMRLKIRKQ
jgi:hypothetical protein